jgi:hypothetical protein
VNVLHDPGGLGFRIESVYAFVSVHDDDDEGIVAATIGGVMLPLIAADAERLEALRPFAVRAARASGRPVRLVRFDRRTDVEVVEP